MGPVAEGNFEAIGHEAFERYILDLMRASAAEEERLHLENRGKSLNPEVRDIQLKGEYPDTGFQIKTYDSIRDLEQEQWYFLWGSSEFFDKDMNPLASPERIVGDTLMWARGG